MRKAQEITLAEAATHILHTCGRHQRPFFFMAGAGLSYPPVPLAGAIVEACKKECAATEAPPGLQDDPMKEYSWWFQQAFHSPSDRQWYLRSIIENKFVSHANLRLAHLLLCKRISNLVVTTNFDEFISKSLTLFGEPHIVCDHPETIQRIDPENDDLQIVHVHGTYWFYDCCNLEDEIEIRSRKSLQTASSMADFLDRILNNRSPLVLGYSGWSGDVFMSALKRRLRRGLPYNIYWFCYQRGAIQALPEELRAHPNVFFVVPDTQKAAADSSRPRAAQTRKATTAQTPSEPTLPASEVLDALVTTFQLRAPPLTRDPLGFFADQLRRSLPQEADAYSSRDIYLIGRVIRRIERAGRSLGATEAKLELVRDALRRSQYKEAIRLGLAPTREELDDDQVRELIEALCLAGSKLLDDSAEELGAYDRVAGLGNDLLEQAPADLALRESVAKASVNRGNADHGTGTFHVNSKQPILECYVALGNALPSNACTAIRTGFVTGCHVAKHDAAEPIPKLPPELATVTRSTVPKGPVNRIPSYPVPRMAPLRTLTPLGPGGPASSPAWTPTPLPGSSHRVGLGVHTTGPITLKPFRSIVTRSAVTIIAVVSRSGSVRLPDKR